jgi:O-antigen/teichoic acid export membrane protein
MMRITRHFVTVGRRRVHYLRAGSGPALALLHASPCSAKVLRPLLPVFGEKFTAGSTALLIMAIAELVNAATGICGAMIDMTGRPKLKLANSILWTGVLVAASALLIPIWGVMGAALAMLISTVVVNTAAVLEIWILEKLVPFERRIWKPLTAGASAFLVGLGLRSLQPVREDWWLAALQAGVVLGVYAGLILGFGLAPEDRMIIDRGRRKVQRLLRRSRTEPETAVGIK